MNRERGQFEMWGKKNIAESKGYIFDNVGDFAFSKNDNKIIFGVYDSDYVPQNADAFFDSSTTRQFKLLDNNSIRTSIIINGEYCPAFEIVDHLQLLKFHNLDIIQILDALYPEVIDQRWNDLRNDYNSMKEYEKNLIKSGGDGYDNLFSEEFEEFRNNAFELAKDYSQSFNEVIHKGFFSYDDSSIIDLSVFNDERMFYWSYEFCETPSGVVMSSLGEFWIEI